MSFQKPNNDAESSDKSSDWIDFFLSFIGKISCGFPRLVLAACFMLAVISIWFTANHLHFNTDRRDLISKNLPYEKLYKQYRENFFDFDGITVVIEGANPDEMKGYAEALVKKLQPHSSIYSEILYKIDIEYFRNKALLYLNKSDLASLVEMIESRRDFLGEINGAPGLNSFMRAINAQISSGMVDTLLSDFLGSSTEKKGTDTADLQLFSAILNQMKNHLNGETHYRSPWRSLLSKKEETLSEEGYMVSDNGKQMFVLINPNDNKDNGLPGGTNPIKVVRGLIAGLKSEFPNVEVGVTGSNVIAADEMATTQTDVQLASLIAFVGVTILFFCAYQGLFKPLLAIFCLLVAISWSLGFTTLAIGHLNILSIVSVTVLIGLGVDFGIHILERYREEKSFGKEVIPALQQTLRKTGHGNMAGAIITAIAFFAMTFTDFTGIAELGLICGGGIILCFIAMIVLNPDTVMSTGPDTSPKFAKLPKSTRPKIEAD